jgi:hypothetical protein
MLQFLEKAGPVIFPLMLLAVVVLILTLWNGLALLVRGSAGASRRRQSIDAILFWGSVAAVLGFLGQWIGINEMAEAVAQRGIVSPQAVVMGISESLLTTVSGMVVFTVSAFLWFSLRVGLWTAQRRS